MHRQIISRCPPSPITITIILIAESMVVCTWVFHPSSAPYVWVLTIAQIACIAFSPAYPRAAFGTALLIDLCGTLLQNDSGPTSLYSLLVAFGFLCFRNSNITSLIASVLICGIQTIGMLWTHSWNDIRTLSSTLIALALTALLGCGLRWQEDALRRRREAEHLHMLLNNRERDINTATQLHDAITNSLSLIARTAQRQMRLNQSDSNQSWDFINQEALNALKQTHLIIENLQHHGKNVTTASASETPFNQYLHTLLKHHDDNLHHLGFSGKSILDDSIAIRLNESEQHLFVMLLNEIYANIARHAPTGCRYDLSILSNERTLEITQINPLYNSSHNDTQPTTELPKSQYGLSALSAQLKTIHGTLTVEKDDMWILFATMPNESNLTLL